MGPSEAGKIQVDSYTSFPVLFWDFGVSFQHSSAFTSQLFQKHITKMKTAVKRKLTLSLGPPNSASKGSQLPCSCKPSVCLASSPAKGLDLLQPSLWDTRSSPVPLSSPCVGLSGSAMTPRGRVQADQPSPGRWPLGGKIALEEQAGVD